MTVPSAYKARVASGHFKSGRWLEIEGLPYAYGTFEASSSFFSTRAAASQFEGIRDHLGAIPRMLGAQIEVLEGGAKTAGSVDFEITDSSGDPSMWAGIANKSGWIELASELSSGAAVVPYTGSGSAFGSSGVLYIGTETIGFTSHDTVAKTFGGLTRGKYRSKAQTFGRGTPIAPRPYTMANRRAWFHEIAVDPTTSVLGNSAFDAERAIRFAGILRSFRLKDNDHGTFVLTVEGMDRELDRNFFRPRTFKTNAEIQDAHGAGGGLQAPGFPGYANEQSASIFAEGISSSFTSDEYVFFKVDHEVFLGQRGPTANPNQMKLVARGLFGTDVVAHKYGAPCSEVMPIFPWDGFGGIAASTSWFRSAPTTLVPLPADHPLMVLLQILLSTGTGLNDAAGRREYDVLPESWGMGIDVSRVNLDEIEAAAMELPQLRISGFIEEPTNFVDFARSICRTFGYYFLTTLGDRWTIRPLRPPMPGTTTRELGNAQRIRGYFTGWDANYGAAVRELIFRYNWNTQTRSFRNVSVHLCSEADVYSKGLARSFTFDAKLVYGQGDRTPGEGPSKMGDLESFFITRAQFLNSRYARPPPVLNERVDWSFIDAEVGDLVSITHSNLPNLATGGRGLSSVIGEIIGKKVDEKSRTIDLTILLTHYQLGDYRFIAPSLEVLSVVSSTVFNVHPNAFTAQKGPGGLTQTDLMVERSDGTLVQTFFNGQTAVLQSANGVTSTNVVLQNVDTVAMQITLASAPALALAAGQTLKWRFYDDAAEAPTAAERPYYAFHAGTADLIAPSNSAGHRIFPR